MTETKKCEYCGREINVKSKICPSCSGEIRNPADQERTFIFPASRHGQKIEKTPWN